MQSTTGLLHKHMLHRSKKEYQTLIQHICSKQRNADMVHDVHNVVHVQ